MWQIVAEPVEYWFDSGTASALGQTGVDGRPYVTESQADLNSAGANIITEEVTGAVFIGPTLNLVIKGGSSVLGSGLGGLSKGTGKGLNLSRNVTKASELDTGMLSKLKNEGTIPSGGRSGGNRPQTGTPNSYVKTDAGHTLVFDGEGKLIYDISSQRVKMTVWDKAPNGNTFPRDMKLEGAVPSDLLQ